MPITVTHAKSNIVADWVGVVTVGNSTGGTATIQGSDLVRPVDWNSAHQVSLSITGSEVASLFNFGTGLSSSTNAGGVSVGFDPVQFFEPFSLLNTNSSMLNWNSASWYVEPIQIPNGLDKGMIRMLAALNSSNFLHGVVGSATNTGQATKSAIFMNRLAIYTRGTGTASTKLESLWTGQCDLSATQSITYSSTATNDVRVTNAITYGFISQIDGNGATTSGTVTTSGSAVVAASTMASTVPNSLITGGNVMDWFTGSVMFPFPLTMSIPPGDMWMAIMMSSSSTGSTTGGGNYLAGTCFNNSPTRMVLLDPVLTMFKQLGLSTAAHSSSVVVPFKGVFQTTQIAAPAQIATSDIRASTGRLYWNYMKTSI
jgi:hypothetical protein